MNVLRRRSSTRALACLIRRAGFRGISRTQHTAEENNPFMRRIVLGLATAVVVSGGGLSLGAGAAHAGDGDDCGPAAFVNGVCWGPNRWCPGDSLFHLTQNHIHDPVTWDMNVCHTYYHVALEDGNQGQGIYEGPDPPPPQAPPERLPPAPALPPGMCWSMWIPAPCPNG
jgi:hypothetical protein